LKKFLDFARKNKGHKILKYFAKKIIMFKCLKIVSFFLQRVVPVNKAIETADDDQMEMHKSRFSRATRLYDFVSWFDQAEPATDGLGQGKRRKKRWIHR